MPIKLLQIIFILLLLTPKAHAYSSNLSLRCGMGLSFGEMNTKIGEFEDQVGYQINSSFEYAIDNWEIGIAGQLINSRTKKIYFRNSNSEISGKGILTNSSFGPKFKYTFNYIKIPKKLQKYIPPKWLPKRPSLPPGPWRIYASAGPIWSLQTLRLTEYTITTGEYDKNFKIQFESRGANIAIGIEEDLPNKNMNPVYIEANLTFLWAHRVSIVDASNFKEVEVLAKEQSQMKIFTKIFAINIGITLF